MIHIEYNRNEHRVTAKGHAKSAPKGEDLICAAVTILMRTIMENSRENCPCGFLGKEGKGYVMIECSERAYDDEDPTRMMDTVCVGFQLLAREYPEYVDYRVI